MCPTETICEYFDMRSIPLVGTLDSFNMFDQFHHMDPPVKKLSLKHHAQIA